MTRKEELQKELADIEAAEREVRASKAHDQLVLFLDNIDTFLAFVDHSRTSCSDAEINNGYTTSGRGGNFRCNRCALLNAKREWTEEESWLRDMPAKHIGDSVGLYFQGIDVHINTTPE